MARRKKKVDLPARIRHLLALDAANLMRKLTDRRDEMVTLFSRLRDREPLLVAAHSWFTTITFGELAVLDPAEQKAASAFYEKIADLRWYMQYTQDMPQRLQQRLDQYLRELEETHQALTLAIGPPDAKGEPVVDAKVIRTG